MGGIAASGRCDPRFAAVQSAFEQSFAEGLEVGASCAVVLDGEPVVDVWGGRCWSTGPEWTDTTLIETRSATKGIAAACLHLLIDRDLVDLDAQVRRYWPELRCEATVRQALAHTAGIPVIDAPLPPGAMVEWEVIAQAVAAQEPLWAPGERAGYHGVTFGWLVGEVVRRVSGRTLGRFLQDEICGPLGVEYWIGTPVAEHRRIAPLVLAPPRLGGSPPAPSFVDQLDPTSLTGRMMAPMFPPICPPWTSEEFLTAEVPVANGVGNARAMATIYAELAADGGRLVSSDHAALLGEEQSGGIDAVFGIEIRRSLGFELPPTGCEDGRPAPAFGHPGATGFLAFGDPDARLGFAYLKNAAWGGPPGTDPRATNLTRALYDSL